MRTEVDESAGNGNATRPSFIDSSPLGADLLEGQSQEQIAKSVSQLIRASRTENRLIGLDGAWGSGKSNLVKIIEAKLKDTHHVFFYDAWGHQEDLQRRAFLEELTADLSDNELVDSKTWTQKLKDLLARKRETLTVTIPRLSHGVIVTLAVVIFTPIAKTIADGIEDQVVKVLITSFPLLIGTIMWIGASIKAGHMLTMQEIYRLYKEKDLINETHVTISEKEPSVREFQNWMKDLSKALKKKKLIIVFDNMDRLPPDKVRELWSSIHTFFAEDSFDRIWVIIPFDRKHIADAFDKNEDVSDQFLSKSFSVIYRVAPPVLTDWQKFFEMKYKEAFGKSEEEELHIIRRAFDLLQNQITPRSIIAFINEMVSLRLVVEDDILLRYIAIFVLTKKEILKAPVDQILSLEFLQKAAPLFREDEDLPNHIAALVYYVPLASASQVSLTREIQNALRDKNGSRLNELAKHRHFIDILEQVIAGDDLDIASSAATLAMLGDELTKNEGVRDRSTKIWDNLCEKELRTPVSQQKFTPTHELLLKYSSQPRRSALAGRIVEGVRNAEQFSGAEYYRAMSLLNDYIKKNKLDVDVVSMVTDIKKAPEVFVDYVRVAGDEYKTFKLKCDESELQEFIAGRIPEELGGLDTLSVVQKDYSFEPLIKRLEKELPRNTLTTENIEPFYKFYKAIATEKPIKSVEDDRINTLLSTIEGDSEGEFELFAMRLARTTSFPNFSGITQTMLVETDEKKANRIAERIQYYTTYGELLLSFVSWPQPLLKVVLRDLTLNSYGTSIMSITDVLKHFEKLHTSLDIAPEDFIKKLGGWVKSAKDKITVENVDDIITDHEFFKYAIEIESELARHINEVMVDHLNSLSVEHWREPLRDEDSYLFRVTYWLLKGGQLTTPPDNAVTVFKDILIEVAKGEFVMGADAGWDVFYERTHKNKLKATAKNIRDLFISETTITADMFITFADILLTHADMKQKSADVARKILAPVVGDERCLAFIVDNDEFFASLVNEAGDDASDFKDIVRQKALTPECSKKVVDFARAIGIEQDNDSKTKEPEQEEGQGN